MRGNRNRTARGSIRPFISNPGSNSAFSSSGNRSTVASSGPLMTNHLQLNDLDLELALLKRKREMIEKQHTMLVNESRFGGMSQYGFEQTLPQSYGQRSEPTRNFAQFYNEPAGKYDRFNSQQGVKRPAIDPWDSSAPKRFNAPSGPKRTPSRFESRPGRSGPASQPPPLMSSSFRPRRPPLASSRSTFRPSKVNKPKQNTAPNKLDSYSVAERKDLVSKASDLTQKNATVFLLEADKPPTPKLLGRLEFALGNLLREMKQQYGETEPHATTLTSTAGQRAVKAAIREQIRAVMIGRPVGAVTDIITQYRKKYPKDNDLDLLNTARESIVQKSNLAIEIIKQVNPERYFKNNFKRLLDKSLNEMFETVKKIYTTAENSKKSLQQIIDEHLMDLEKSLQDTKDDSKETPNESLITEDTEMDESGAKSAENSISVEENAEINTAETKPEGDVATTEENVKPDEENAKTDEDKEGNEKPDDGVANSDVVQSEENGSAVESKPNGDLSVEAASKEAKETPKKRYSSGRDEVIREKFYYRLMESLLKRHLPTVLPRYKELIMRILSDKEFRETKAYLVKTTNEKAEEMANKHNATITPPTKTNLFVKVMGRPSLPKKKIMKAFLDSFYPKLIKKHRNMHNVLFVSFDSKENFDKILAENGSTLGTSQLDIKVSERINKNKPQKQTGTDEVAGNQDDDVEIVEPKPDETVKLDESLDNQIDDLLTSIREEEEKKEDEEPDNNEGKGDEEIDEVNLISDTDEEKAATGEQEVEGEAKVEAQNGDNKLEVVQKGVEAVKNEAPAKATPTRSSARLTSTPSAVRTRRASKLIQ